MGFTLLGQPSKDGVPSTVPVSSPSTVSTYVDAMLAGVNF
jgi:hypothetical protein